MKAGSCGPVITVTAEWSVHGFAGTEEEQCGGNSHPQRLTANNDARIFTQVTKCHKKAHTHALPPALPLTHLAPNPGTHRRRHRCTATTPQHMPPTIHDTHSNIQRQIPRKGILPTHGHMPQHESHPRVTTHTATCEHATLHARTTDNMNASKAGEQRTRS